MVLEDAGICMAAEYLLDVHSAVRILLATGQCAFKKRPYHLCLRHGDYSGDILLYALGADPLRDPDLHRGGDGVAGPVLRIVGAAPGVGGVSGERCTVFPDPGCEQRISGL